MYAEGESWGDILVEPLDLKYYTLSQWVSSTHPSLAPPDPGSNVSGESSPNRVCGRGRARLIGGIAQYANDLLHS